jgi:hypothetical protein
VIGSEVWADDLGPPVWFVFEGEKLYLLPVQGSDTQWYNKQSRDSD